MDELESDRDSDGADSGGSADNESEIENDDGWILKLASVTMSAMTH